MYNGGKIIFGLIIFLALVTFPFYSNMGKSAKKAMPSLDTPAIHALAKKECVRSGKYMRKNHMKVLDQWRDEVVREGKREKINVGGREIDKSLQNGCLKCHSNKEQFCTEGHKYAGVAPYCWDCHFDREVGRL